MRTRSNRRQRSRKMSQTGGDSAWEWQLNNLGDGWTQFTNTFKGNLNNQSNSIVQNHPKMMMKGGKRRRSSRGKRGGFFGAVLEQAAVPLAVLGAQQYYGKRHTRKHNRRSKSFKRRAH
jgi:hypothetical protein